MRVLITLPDRDFDVTEVAVPWQLLREAGHQVVFATELAGTIPAGDPRLLDGVIFGQLGAAPEARGFYAELTRAAEFTSPVAWAGLDPAAFDACLPRYMERMAYLATAWRLGRYYRTYPAYVQDEVEAALDDPGSQFQRGPLTLTARGTATDDTSAFAVTDRNYLSARWPGDAYLFARRFCDLLQPTVQVAG